MAGIPTELSLEMHADKEVTLPRFTGYISRSLLLAMVRRVDPREAQVLHESQTQKPYLVTPLRFRSRARTEEGYVLGQAYACRVGFRVTE